MPRYRGPKTENLSSYIQKSKYPITDGYTERNLLKHYNFWPRRTGKSLFQQVYLGETYTEKPLTESVVKWKMRIRKKKKMHNVEILNRMFRENPEDGREIFSGPRKLNRTEHVPSDLARHIKSCGTHADLTRGIELHEYISRSDFRDSRYLANLLVEMYGKCGRIEDALRVFQEIEEPNVFSYNILITAFVSNGLVQDGKHYFDGMPQRDVVTWNTMVAAYAQKGQPDEAGEAFNRMPYRGVVSWTAMVTVYAETSRIEDGRALFDEMPERSVVSWNAMLQALVRNAGLDEATELFDTMPERDVVSWTAMVTAYGDSLRLDDARIYFDRMPKRDTVSWNAMIEAYAQNRQLEEARRIFERMPCPDNLSWPAIIRAYANCGHVVEARVLFDRCPYQMNYTWSAIVAAYAQNGHMEEARRMFARTPHRNSRAWNSLIAGFLHKGDIEEAESVFWEMPMPDVTSWNALIHVYARTGRHPHAFCLGMEMALEGTDPDEVSFTGLLNACNHMGSVQVARETFLSIYSEHFMQPTVDHYCCMINVMGRAGKLHQAEELIGNMPFLPDAVTWTTLLGACKVHGDVRLGTIAARHVFQLDPTCPSPYLLLKDLETSPP